MGDRIVVMKDGIIQQVDTPETIYTQPNNTFVASFIGSPPMNFIDGRILENVPGKLEFHTPRFAIEIPEGKAHCLVKNKQVNRTVTLGIRPENVSLEEIVFQAFPNAVVPGVFKISELMGADRFLHLDIGQERMLVARVNPRYHYAEEDKIKVAIDMSKALFFHSETGERFMD